MPASARSWRHLLVALPAAAVGATVFVLAVAAGRGLDFSDEGMYLYSADPGADGVAFHNAFGRVTGLLYGLVGHDVVRFRWAGLLLLVMAAVLLGDRIAALGARVRGRPAEPFERVLAATLVVAGALHYYSLALLTPSYNWLNLMGLIVATAAALELLGRDEPSGPWGWIWASSFAVALFAATMGKLSSGPMMVAAVVVMRVWTGCGSIGARLAQLLRALPAGVVTLVVFGIAVDPPWVTISEIRRGSRLLAVLDPGAYSILAASREMARAGLTLVRGAPLGILPGVAVVAVGSAWLARRPEHARWRSGFHAAAFGIAGVGCWIAGAWVGGQSGYGRVGWAWIGLTFTAVAVGVDLLGPWSRSRRSTADALAVGSRSRPTARRDLIAASALCVIAGVAYAFGSGNGFFPQTGGAVALFVAPIVLLGGLPRSRADLAAVPVAAAACVLVAGAVLLITHAIHRPYRQPDLATATVRMGIGERGGSVLVTPGRAELVERLRAAADEAGFAPGAPMLDFTHYSATLLYLLDAEPPPTILVSVGGYDTVDDLARATLTEAARVDRARWADAWLLTSEVRVAGFAPDPKLVRLLGRRFPDDYRPLGSFEGPDGTIVLWRPRR